MAARIVRQPNGRLARFSEVVDNFTHTNHTTAAMKDFLLDSMGRHDADEKIARADADLGRFDEAIEIITRVHGKKEADKYVKLCS